MHVLLVECELVRQQVGALLVWQPDGQVAAPRLTILDSFSKYLNRGFLNADLPAGLQSH